MEVLLKTLADAVELCIYLRHCGLKALEVLVMLGLGSLVERVWSTDTCNNVLALGIDKPLAVELVVTGRRVAAECHACS